MCRPTRPVSQPSRRTGCRFPIPRSAATALRAKGGSWSPLRAITVTATRSVSPAVAQRQRQESVTRTLPAGMVRHWPLQKLRDNRRHDGLCPANDDASRKIRRHVKLGTEMVTDVFELQLDALPSTETGKGQAAAIGAALREALGARLGVDAETMGLAVAPSLRPDEARRSAVFLYDKASGDLGLPPLRIVTCQAFCARPRRALAVRQIAPQDARNACCDAICNSAR